MAKAKKVAANIVEAMNTTFAELVPGPELGSLARHFVEGRLCPAH